MLDDINAINYYINTVIRDKFAVRDLCKKIKNNEYERLDENTRKKIVNNKKLELIDTVKNPILIKNTTDMDNVTEVKIGNKYNYIDEHVKTIEQNKTIGIIIVKEDNKFIMHYCTDDKIISREYEFI